MGARRLLCLLAIAGAVAAPARVFAQAFTLPRGSGMVTLAGQYVQNTGHRFTDGYLRASGQSVTASLLLEVEYGVSDRLSASVGVPYVFAKYTGALPPPSTLPVDACRCWNSSFQDFSLAARYRFGGSSWAVTPTLRYDRPTHDYAYQGEAVVGRDLNELLLGVSAGTRLGGALSRASLQLGYTYAIVEKPLEDVPINRSNTAFEVGYALSSRLYLRATAAWQHTHGGLRAGSVTGVPFPLPGELAPSGSERYLQRDRVLRSRYWQAGGGVAYSLGALDVFASFAGYVWGRDAHDGQVYNAGVTWYFDR